MRIKNLLPTIKFLIGWPLSLVSIIFIVKYILDKSNELTFDLRDINLAYLFLGVLLFFIYYSLRSFLWQFQLKEKGYRVPFVENTYRFAFSELKRYTPGNIWSFLSRAHQFAELKVDNKTIGLSMLADIQLVIIGCAIASVFAVPWLLDSPRDLKSIINTVLPISGILILIYFAVTGFIYKKKYEKEASWTSALVMPGFKFESKVKLMLISGVTYFIFGVAHFFVLISVINTGFTDFLSLSSFFVFSLLVGYLSFITPMGLGVREAVVTVGLSKIMTVASAGAFSIFSRIVLVTSELAYLGLVFRWRNINKS